MLYVIIATDVANSASKRQQARQAHLSRLHRLRDEGRLILAGPFPALDTEQPGEAGFTGSLIVAEFESLEKAQEFADADPYKASGAYDQVTVKPFKQVLP